MFRFLRDDCDEPEAPAPAAPAVVAQDTFSPRLPRPRRFPRSRDYRGIFDQSIAQDLARSTESGAALESVAPALSSNAGSGASAWPGGLIFAAIVGLIYVSRPSR